ncbi:septum formation protein Maf [Myxococcota bacterium]|nr:septum formation protein Maf [Myxococcota bacterium]
MKKIILASQSVYKKRMVENLGIHFEAESPRVDEVVLPGESPEETVLRLSVEKAEAVAARHPEAIVVATDQAVSIDGELLGKPGTFEAAKEHLSRMQGRTHKLLTAVTVIGDGHRESALEIHHMTMRPLSTSAIARYLVKDQPLDSAGSYKIETMGISLFSSISGNDPVAIMGVPMIALTKLLLRWGIEIP